MRRISGVLGILWLFVLPMSQAGAVTVDGIRLWAGPDSTRVVFDLSERAAHSVFTLRNPDRVVIDLKSGRLDMPRLPEGTGYVAGIRSARQPDGSLRVVLDLTGFARPKTFYVPPNDTYGHRLVVDLVPDSPPAPVRKVATGGPGRDVLVAIDAGHGGEDPGAIGRGGTMEKNVVLQIARRVARRVEAEPGMHAFLVRDGDYFIPLRQRMEKARAHDADLFVSIHADSYRSTRARGATVYILSERGASDEAARRLAERENASDLVGGVSLADKDSLLASVLLDLSQTAALSASNQVADRLIREMSKVTTLRKHTVQQARFVVLKSPDIPSVLIETAYISNPREERGLRDHAHQDRLAAAITAGIRSYFRANPPPGSYLALNADKLPRAQTQYVITRGDTLSEIAGRYGVSLAALRRENGLSSDRIRVGQVLTIPSS